MKEDINKEWHVKKSGNLTNKAIVLAICGPSAVGKTTLIKAVSNSYPVFIETTKGNPHLDVLIRKKPNFDAAANQRWFLSRIAKHIAGADPKLPLILDQDPAAIVLAYSKMFFEEGKIKKAQYASLLKRLSKIEETLHRWYYPRTVLFLDAPADVLYHRAITRRGKTLTPSLQWFERVRNYFIQLSAYFPNALTISTDKTPAEQMTARVRTLIEQETRDSQA